MKIRRFPRTKPRRFPRTIRIVSVEKFSMNRIYETLYKIAKGKPVSSKEEMLACRWFGMENITPEAADVLKTGKTPRFPRSKQHGKKT